MTPIHSTAEMLRRFNPRVRATIYTALVLIGAALSACQAFGIDKLGSVTIDQALTVYASLAPLTGVVAVANVTGPATGEEYADLEEPADLSLFEPIGNPEDVYAV